MANAIRRSVATLMVLSLPVASAPLCRTALAATIAVTTDQDGAPGTVNGCSLREAVRAINNQVNGNGCNNTSNEPYGTDDRISFSADGKQRIADVS